MGNTYYPQTDNPGPTMRIRDLLEALSKFNPDELVVFKTPLYGAFGSGVAYSIDGVGLVEMKERHQNFGPQTDYDEETNTETVSEDDYIQVFPSWRGVVIS